MNNVHKDSGRERAFDLLYLLFVMSQGFFFLMVFGMTNFTMRHY